LFLGLLQEYLQFALAGAGQAVQAVGAGAGVGRAVVVTVREQTVQDGALGVNLGTVAAGVGPVDHRPLARGPGRRAGHHLGFALGRLDQVEGLTGLSVGLGHDVHLRKGVQWYVSPGETQETRRPTVTKNSAQVDKPNTRGTIQSQSTLPL